MYDYNMTSQNYWSKQYENHKVIKYGLYKRVTEPPLFRRLKLVFKKQLPLGKGKKILEIGCAPGRWLVYFHRELDYAVYGVDYSQVGCALTEETLGKNGVSGEIICDNVSDVTFLNKYEGFFDVVYSLGLVEHFTDPTDIISVHLRLLRKGGFLVVGMPNFGDGTIMRLFKKMMGGEKDLVETHNTKLMKLPEFKKYLSEFEGMEIRMLDYIGPIMIPLFEVRYVGYALNLVIGYPTFYLNSESLSSYILLISRKC